MANSKLRFRISMSLDGFVAGPEQSVDKPLGVGGMRLHGWVFGLRVWRTMHGQSGGEDNASSRVVEESSANIGATIMGRNMFGGHPGPWRGRTSLPASLTKCSSASSLFCWGAVNGYSTVLATICTA
jgi:hypothetical protein